MATTNNVKNIPIFHACKDKDTLTAEGFIKHIEDAAQILKWEDDEKIVQLTMATHGRAKNWATFFPNTGGYQNTWEFWRTNFINAYGLKISTGEVQKNVEQVRMTAQDTAVDFQMKVEQAIHYLKMTTPAVATPNIDAADAVILSDEFFQPFTPGQMAALRSHFNKCTQHGVKETFNARKMEYFMTYVLPEYRAAVEDKNPATFEEAIKFLDNIMQQRKSSKAMSNLKIHEVHNQDTPVNAISTPTEGAMSEKVFEAMAAKYFNKFGNQKPNSHQGKPQHSSNANHNNQKPKKKGFCHYCNIEGHWQEECRKRLSDNKPCKDRDGRYYQPGPNRGKRVYLSEAGMSNLDFLN